MSIWILRLSITLIFLVFFLVRGSRAWGIGLIGVSAALLLDALRARDLLTEVGFFGYLIGGVLAAAAFVWLSELLQQGRSDGQTFSSFRYANNEQPKRTAQNDASGIDRQLLQEQIRQNLSADDMLDLIFDLGLKESEVINPAQPAAQMVTAIVDHAAASNKMTQIALSVERILTPMSIEHLPKAERLSAETPPHILREFLVRTYTLPQLSKLASEIGVDWLTLGSDAKKSRVRRLLNYAQRRNLTAQLLNGINEISVPSKQV